MKWLWKLIYKHTCKYKYKYKHKRWSDDENTICTNVPTAVNCFENKQTQSLNLEIDHTDPPADFFFQNKMTIMSVEI